MIRSPITQLMILLATGQLLYGADWPQWLGPERTGITDESDWSHDWGTTGPRVGWQVDLGQPGSAGPIVVGDRVVVITSKVVQVKKVTAKSNRGLKPDEPSWGSTRTEIEVDVRCYGLDDGRLLWQRTFAETGGWGGGGVGPGPAMTPCATDGRLFLLGRAGMARCLELASGEPVWERDLFAEEKPAKSYTGYEASPIVVGDKVFFAIGSPAGVALAIDDGATVWKQTRERHPTENFSDGAPTHASPRLFDFGAGPRLCQLGGKGLNIIDPDSGAIDRHIPFPAANHYRTANGWFIDGDRLVLGRLGSTQLFMADAGEPSGYRSLWRAKGMPMYGNIIVHDQRIFGNGQCWKLADGSVIWTADWARDRRKEAEGGTIRAGNRLIMIGGRGEITIHGLDTDSFRPLASGKLFAGKRVKIWAPPALSDGRLLVRDSGGLLACYDLRP